MKSIHKDSLVILGIVAALVVAAYFVVYRPQSRELDSLKAAELREQSKLQSTAAEAAVVPALMRRVDEMRAQYSNFDRRLPKQQELAGFLRDISADLSRQKFVDQVIEPGSPTKGDMYHTLPIIVRFKGSYLAVGQFLTRLDKMERLTRVQRLVIAPSSGDKDCEKTNELGVELQMNIYFTES